MRTFFASAFYTMAALVFLLAINYFVDDIYNWRIIVFLSGSAVEIWQDAIVVLCLFTLALYCFLRGTK